MIRHQAIRSNPDTRFAVNFLEDRFEYGIIGGLLKKREPSHPTIQDVIGKPPGGDARTTRHT